MIAASLRCPVFPEGIAGLKRILGGRKQEQNIAGGSQGRRGEVRRAAWALQCGNATVPAMKLLANAHPNGFPRPAHGFSATKFPEYPFEVTGDNLIRKSCRAG